MGVLDLSTLKIMIRKTLLVAFFVVSMVAVSSAQSNKASPQVDTVEETEEELVEGFWSVTAYLGKKLVDGMSERLNLDDDKAEENLPRKKVTLRVGTFEFERIEGQ